MSRITLSLAALSVFAVATAHADMATISKVGANQVVSISGGSRDARGIVAEEIYTTLSKGGAPMNRRNGQLAGKTITATAMYLNGVHYRAAMQIEKGSSSVKATSKDGKIVSLSIVGETAENLFDFASKADLPVILRMGATTIKGKYFSCNHKMLAPQYKDVAFTCTIEIK